MYRYYIRKKGKDWINPYLGVERNKEKPKKHYIEDWEYLAVREIISPALQMTMDIAYLTGQRISIILNLKIK